MTSSEEDVACVLVTGVSGYLATHIAQQLLQSQKYKVRGTVRSLGNSEKTAPLEKLCPDAKYPLQLVEADLQNLESWNEAVKDCTYVIHVASPFPMDNPPDENTVIQPAVEGTLNVLKACSASRCVKRVVLTGAGYSIHHPDGDTGEEEKTRVYTEEDWSNPDTTHSAYIKSKILAEKAAWKFYEEQKEEEGAFEMCVAIPVAILGPLLCGAVNTSAEIMVKFFSGMPGVPRLALPIIDVRDTAKGHIICMEQSGVDGNRYILYNCHVTMLEICQILDEEFRSQGYNLPLRMLPDWLVKFAAIFKKELRPLKPLLGRKTQFGNKKMLEELHIKPHDVKDTLIDMAHSLIERGKIRKTPQYKGGHIYAMNC